MAGVLTDTEIQDAVTRGWLISKETYSVTSLEPSSYDIRVGLKGIIGGEGIELDLRKETMELGPGSYAGVISYEKMHFPDDVCARIGSKRALSYDGIILLTGAIVDPGYEGHLLFGLYNASQRKAHIRYNRKLCNIVFERLIASPERVAPSDPNLLVGNFPDAFLDHIANMEVLPWMQISERVKQIENITKDIIDLKARYEDVLQPIRDLTANVRTLTQDVSALATQAKSIAGDVETLNGLVTENSKQINQLTSSLAVVGNSVQILQERGRGLEDSDRVQTQALTALQTSFGRYQILAYIFWAIVLLGAGALLPTIVERLWPRSESTKVSAPAQQTPQSKTGTTTVGSPATHS